ncbi:hypothetical protein BC567DRAFT_213663 [Phyllosticta citribraziliensis]
MLLLGPPPLACSGSFRPSSFSNSSFVAQLLPFTQQMPGHRLYSTLHSTSLAFIPCADDSDVDPTVRARLHPVAIWLAPASSEPLSQSARMSLGATTARSVRTAAQRHWVRDSEKLDAVFKVRAAEGFSQNHPSTWPNTCSVHLTAAAYNTCLHPVVFSRALHWYATPSVLIVKFDLSSPVPPIGSEFRPIHRGCRYICSLHCISSLKYNCSSVPWKLFTVDTPKRSAPLVSDIAEAAHAGWILKSRSLLPTISSVDLVIHLVSSGPAGNRSDKSGGFDHTPHHDFYNYCGGAAWTPCRIPPRLRMKSDSVRWSEIVARCCSRPLMSLIAQITQIEAAAEPPVESRKSRGDADGILEQKCPRQREAADAATVKFGTQKTGGCQTLTRETFRAGSYVAADDALYASLTHWGSTHTKTFTAHRSSSWIS